MLSYLHVSAWHAALRSWWSTTRRCFPAEGTTWAAASQRACPGGMEP